MQGPTDDASLDAPAPEEARFTKFVDVESWVVPRDVLPPRPRVGRLLETPLAWRVRNSGTFWRDVLHAPEHVLSVVENGYSLPFIKYPSRVWRPNHPKCAVYADFIDKSVTELLKNGCVIEVKERPWIVCALNVDDSRESLRLIYDARPINDSLFIKKFKYEGVHTLRDSSVEGDFMFQFDIQSAYPHIQVVEHHWGVLGFEWRGRWYVYCVLPFGLATAPYVFTKTLAVVRTYLRAHGVKISMLLDDGLCVSHTAAQARTHAHFVRSVLRSAGLTEHPIKSKWEPSHSTEAFLGFRIDLSANTIGLKQSRVEKALKALVEPRREAPIPRRKLASLAGQLLAMGPVLGAVTRLQTRGMYALIGGDKFWGGVVSWTDEAWSELCFWRSFAAADGLTIQVPFWVAPVAVEMVAESDASDTGMGVLLRAPGEPVVTTFAPLQLPDREKSSTWRELAAVELGVESFAERVRGCVVKWCSDNQAAVLILQNGSRVPELQVIARRVYVSCASWGVRLVPVWVPREENTEADALSRAVDLNDWGVADGAFQRISTRWGAAVADLFADNTNARAASFFAQRPLPGATGVDGLTASWPPGLLFACPPWALLGRLLRRLMTSKRKEELVIIVPLWPSQPWWPVLCPDGNHPVPQVVEAMDMGREDFRLGPSGRPGFIVQQHWRFQALALRWSNSSSTHRPAFCLNRARGRECECCR